MSVTAKLDRLRSVVRGVVGSYAVRLAAVLAVPTLLAVSAVVQVITGEGPVSSGRLGLVAGAVAVPTVVAYLYGRKTAADVSAIEGAARRLAIGDDGVEPGVRRRDEIGRLGGAFVAVRDSLTSRVREAERARREAQREVAADYCETIRQCGDGDLSVRLDPDRADGGLRAVARAFNDAMDRLEFTAADLHGLGEETAAGSRRVEDGVRELLDAGDAVAGDAHRRHEAAQQRHELHRRAARDVSEVSLSADRIAEHTAELREAAARPVERAQETRRLAEGAVEAVDRAAGEADTAEAEVAALDATVEDVERLTERLSRMATAANRAALNATIAATGEDAPDDGDVGAVTDELRGLASTTRETADEAESVAAELRSQVATTETAVRGARDAIEESGDAVTDTAATADRTRAATERVTEELDHLAAATAKQAEGASEAAALVEEAAATGEGAIDDAEQVAGAVEDQLEAVETLAEWSRALSDRAADLESGLETLSTGAEASASDPEAADRRVPVADGGRLGDRGDPTEEAGPERGRGQGDL